MLPRNILTKLCVHVSLGVTGGSSCFIGQPLRLVDQSFSGDTFSFGVCEFRLVGHPPFRMRELGRRLDQFGHGCTGVSSTERSE